MRLYLLLFLTLLLNSCSSTRTATLDQSKAATYRYRLDLNEWKNDQISVALTLSNIKIKKPVFCIPRIVPGIYGAMDFGKYVNQLKAIAKNGEALSVIRLDSNRWEIDNTEGSLHTITYSVDDIWEEYGDKVGGKRYLSSASSFQENAMLINHNCVFGYIQDLKSVPFQIEVNRPDDWYPATSLTNYTASGNTDLFIAEDYHALVDAPVLYARPDTANISLPDIEVQVAAYSTTGKPIAKSIAQFIAPLLENQRAYLGGKLPVSQYTFIIYHNPNLGETAFLGDGLEHASSTIILLYMPMDEQILRETVYSIASHEFFHTIMPIGLHSYEIENYDFIDPGMSQHLWLYEGTTEYFSIHMPVRQGLQSPEQFAQVVERKIAHMQEFDNAIPLTTLSKNAMERQDQYYNFYLRGTLTNLCLDILLREQSGGNYGVQNLINDLVEQYGPGQPFEDDALFEAIVQQCDFAPAEVEQFINSYIKGGAALPLKEYLHKAGFDYDEDKVEVSVMEEVRVEQAALRKQWLGAI